MSDRTRKLEAVLAAAVAAAPRARKITFTVDVLAQWGAHVLGSQFSHAWWGTTLQRYRLLKVREYTVACEGYGAGAVWTVYVIPAHSSLTRLRLSRQHAIASAIDGVRRLYRDLDTETLPGLKLNGESKADITFRIEEFAVNGVSMVQAAGLDRTGSMGVVLPLAEKLRERWAA